jgi:hypothetical protein
VELPRVTSVEIDTNLPYVDTMAERLAADAVLLLHLAFIAFVIVGALLALRWRLVALVQIPAVAWAVFVEATGRTCPLTFAENHFRLAAGASGYGESFVEHYLLRIIYPDGLTSTVQIALAVAILVVNVAIYCRLLLHRQRATAAHV